ncbi:MAG: hypothetical protein H7Z43_06850, partial [Clostridia bacterium]|nr:hypothetical protein [Deltaproteobacteria bacterium]
MRRIPLFLFVLFLSMSVSCAHHPGPYQDTPVLWHDDDRHPINQPEAYYSSLSWDGVDNTMFVNSMSALAVEVDEPAKNVNAHDEVPDSSWFTNRIGRMDVSPERFAQGACDPGEKLSDEVWLATSGKVDGGNPGFAIEDPATGRKYLLKFDSAVQPERASSADVIGSKIYWAFGYSSPCNFMVFFDDKHIKLAPDASKEDALGGKIPLTQEDLEKAMSTAAHTEEGLIRGSASRFVTGKPVGPWTYDGTRDDDPNDVIPHEERREIRAGRVPAAWINHFDSREQNTLTTFVATNKDDKQGWVEHYIIDFGDSMGSVWPSDEMTRRFGHSYYFDWGDIGSDLVTLGLRKRIWEKTEMNPRAKLFGYFDSEHFYPEKWKGGYFNHAFDRMDFADGYWGAQIISRITDAHIAAAIATAYLSKPDYVDVLQSVLVERRNRIVKHWMYPVSSFQRPVTDASSLCFIDALVEGGYESADKQHYEARVGDNGHAIGEWVTLKADARGRICTSVDA